MTKPTICALLTTKEEDVILDCFSGTGVVGEFARKNYRYYIGYEFKPEFALVSEVRLVKIPPPGMGMDDFALRAREEYLDEHVYPKWEEEKKANKIKNDPPKEVFTPEQKA
jgi:hypothetical protein